MPTVTVVFGQRGKGLVASALFDHVDNSYLVKELDSEFWLKKAKKEMPQDIFLLSTTGAEREDWMGYWFLEFGIPLYDIFVRRNDVRPDTEVKVKVEEH